MAGIVNRFLRKSEKTNPNWLTLPWTVKVNRLPEEEGVAALQCEAGEWNGQKVKWQFYLKKETVGVEIDGQVENVVYIGIFLRLHPDSKTTVTASTIMAHFSVKILHPTSKAILYSSFTKPYDYTKRAYGLKHFLRAEELPKFSDKNGDIHLLVTLEPSKGTASATGRTPEQNMLRNQSESRCRKEIGSEDIIKIVTITTSDGFKYQACKPVLEARSKYFKAELKKLEETMLPFDEYQFYVTHSHDVFKVIFCHILHGHLIPALLDSTKTKMTYVIELMKAAELYGQDDLKTFLSDYPGLTDYVTLVENSRLNNFEEEMMSCEDEVSCDDEMSCEENNQDEEKK